MPAIFATNLYDPTSWSGMFFLQVVAVVVGGVLLLIVVTALGWLGIPFKWCRKNKELLELIRSRKKFLLIYPTPDGRKQNRSVA